VNDRRLAELSYAERLFHRVAQKVSHCQISNIVLNRIKACQWD